MKNLNFEELVQACNNVGVDLQCGACAAIFFTGVGLPHDTHTCKKRDSMNIWDSVPSVGDVVYLEGDPHVAMTVVGIDVPFPSETTNVENKATVAWLDTRRAPCRATFPLVCLAKYTTR